MTTTKTQAIDATSALTAEYQRLSLLANTGDAAAVKLLMACEDRLDAMARAERRAAAAAIEEQRLAGEAQRQASLHAQAKKVADYEVALEGKVRAFSLVEQVVEELISAVKLAVLEGNEAHAAALRLGVSPGILASSQIATYIAWKLGRDGVDTAGLSDMAPVFAPMRVPLISPTQES
jgi:hypothetical protein